MDLQTIKTLVISRLSAKRVKFTGSWDKFGWNRGYKMGDASRKEGNLLVYVATIDGFHFHVYEDHCQYAKGLFEYKVTLKTEHSAQEVADQIAKNFEDAPSYPAL